MVSSHPRRKNVFLINPLRSSERFSDRFWYRISLGRGVTEWWTPSLISRSCLIRTYLLFLSFSYCYKKIYIQTKYFLGFTNQSYRNFLQQSRYIFSAISCNPFRPQLFQFSMIPEPKWIPWRLLNQGNQVNCGFVTYSPSGFRGILAAIRDMRWHIMAKLRVDPSITTGTWYLLPELSSPRLYIWC